MLAIIAALISDTSLLITSMTELDQTEQAARDLVEESVSFAVGEKFASYDELKTKIKAYENSRSVQLCHSDSRTLEAAKKRIPRKVERAKKDLVYYHISLSCVFGGKKYHNKGSGKRPRQR